MFARNLPALVIALALVASGSALGAERVVNVGDFDAKADGTTLSTRGHPEGHRPVRRRGRGHGTLPAGQMALRGDLAEEQRRRCCSKKGPRCWAAPTSTTTSCLRRPRRIAPRATQAAKALIVGEQLQHVAIRGQGTIDGNGAHFRDKTKRRPKVLMFVGCRDVLVEGVRLQSGRKLDAALPRLRATRGPRHHRLQPRDLQQRRPRRRQLPRRGDLPIARSTPTTTPCASRASPTDRAGTSRSATAPSAATATRIKMGTESGGGFRDITVRDCTCLSPRHSQGHLRQAARPGRDRPGDRRRRADGQRGRVRRPDRRRRPRRSSSAWAIVAAPTRTSRPKPGDRHAAERDAAATSRPRRRSLDRLFDRRPARPPGRERRPQGHPADVRRRRAPRAGLRPRCPSGRRPIPSARCSARCRPTGSTAGT